MLAAFAYVVFVIVVGLLFCLIVASEYEGVDEPWLTWDGEEPDPKDFE
jgi:hypothetical protein